MKRIRITFDINCTSKHCSFLVARTDCKIPEQCEFLSAQYSFCSIFQTELNTNSRGIYKRCKECLKTEID